MSDELTVAIDSEDLGQIITERGFIVPRQAWGKALRKIFLSSAPIKEKIEAIQSDASSKYRGAKLFEPRSPLQFEEGEGNVLLGVPYEIHDKISDDLIDTVMVGLCKVSENWVYASTLQRPFSTVSTIPQSLWVDESNPGELASIVDIGTGGASGTSDIRLTPEHPDDIESYFAYLHSVDSPLKFVDLSQFAIAEIFDLGRSLASYDKITYILTGTFYSASTSVPAITTGSGYKKESQVVIQLGTDSSPCFILGRGGSTKKEGGSALRLDDMNPKFSLVKGNNSSLIAGGGGGGCSFQCFSKESKSGFIVQGGGGAIGGLTDGDFFNKGEGLSRSSQYSQIKTHISSPPRNLLERGEIKSITAGEVEIFENYHNLCDGDRVIVSVPTGASLDWGMGSDDATPLASGSSIYYVETTGPKKFQLYNDELITSASPLQYSSTSAQLYGLSGITNLGGIGQRIYGDNGLGVEIETSWETNLGGFLGKTNGMEAISSGYSERVILEGHGVAGLDDGPFAAILTETGIGAEGEERKRWTIGELTGDFGTNSWNDPTIKVHFLDSSSGDWSFLGHEGQIKNQHLSIPGHKTIEVSGNGGWYGSSGQKTEIKKIYNEDLYRENPTEGYSINPQLGGSPGPAITSVTTSVSGSAALNLSELRVKNWILGEVRTISNSPNASSNKTFEVMMDYNEERVQEDTAFTSIIQDLTHAMPILVGGIDRDGDGNIISSSGIFTNQE